MKGNNGSKVLSGIDAIDQQRNEIMRRLNVLKEMQEGADIAVASHALDELIDYAKGHFAFEEHLIEASHYEFCNAHRRLHELFIARLTKYQAAHKSGEAKTSEIYNFLRAWFNRHITSDDFNYIAATRNSIVDLLSDTKEGGWYSRTMKQCFPQRETNELTRFEQPTTPPRYEIVTPYGNGDSLIHTADKSRTLPNSAATIKLPSHVHNMQKA